MEPRRHPLNRVLLAAIGGVAVGAVVLTAALTLGLLRLAADGTALDEMRREADRFRSFASGLDRIGVGRMAPRVIRSRVAGTEIRFVPADLGMPPELDDGEGRVSLEGEDILYVTAPATVAGREGTILVFRPASEVRGPARAIATRMLLAGGLALAASAAVALVVSRRISQPLDDLAGAARGMARGERVVVPETKDGLEPEEVAELRRAFRDLGHDLVDARDRERSFLLSVTHELRTPLTAIRGYGEALADGTVRDAAKAGNVIHGESRRLERLVGDLIELARVQAGEFSVQLEPMRDDDLCSGVVDALRPRAEEADVGLEVHIDEPAEIVTDPDRAHQMLTNLVENALRVTPSGGVVQLRSREGALEVSDTGPGLSPEDLEHAFDRFYLWRKYRGERPVGSGLGLAVVAELARALQVRIAVRSEPGAGATFSLAFPHDHDESS